MTSPQAPWVILKHIEGCWVCRYRRKHCEVLVEDVGNQNRPCVDCTRFNIRCSGRGLHRPPGMESKQITAKTKAWIRGGNLSGPPLDPFSDLHEQPLQPLAFPGPSLELMIPLDIAEDDDNIDIPESPTTNVNDIGPQLSRLDNNRESGPTVERATLNQMVPKGYSSSDYCIVPGDELASFRRENDNLTPWATHMPHNLDQGLVLIDPEQPYVQTSGSHVPDDGLIWKGTPSSTSAFWEKEYWS